MSEGVWVLLGAIVGMIGTGISSWLLQSRQFNHEKEMYQLRNKSAEMVKNQLIEMLNHRIHTDRSFKALRGAIGGYSEDQIRQFLHEVGAKKVTGKDGEELWYLASREEERSAKKKA